MMRERYGITLWVKHQVIFIIDESRLGDKCISIYTLGSLLIMSIIFVIQLMYLTTCLMNHTV